MSPLAAQGAGPGVHGAAPGVGAALQPRGAQDAGREDSKKLIILFSESNHHKASSSGRQQQQKAKNCSGGPRTLKVERMMLII